MKKRGRIVMDKKSLDKYSENIKKCSNEYEYTIYNTDDIKKFRKDNFDIGLTIFTNLNKRLINCVFDPDDDESSYDFSTHPGLKITYSYDPFRFFLEETIKHNDYIENKLILKKIYNSDGKFLYEYIIKDYNLEYEKFNDDDCKLEKYKKK